MCTTTKGQQTDPFTLPYPVFNPLSLFLNHPLSLSHKYSTPLFSKRQIRNWSSCHLLGINSFYFFKIHHFSDLLADEAGLGNKNKKSDQAVSLLPEDSSNTHCHLCLQSHLIINWYHALNRSLSNREWLTLVYTENEGSIPNPKLPFKTIRQMPLFQGQNAECRGHWSRQKSTSVPLCFGASLITLSTFTKHIRLHHNISTSIYIFILKCLRLFLVPQATLELTTWLRMSFNFWYPASGFTDLHHHVWF